MTTKPKLLIICGPTASSKSAYAMDLATKIGGAIINADSMQVYREIPIITASPSQEDKAKIPHYLYNHISIREEYSVAKYLAQALQAIEDTIAKSLVPIIVGGTGLYINTLLNGLSAIPDIDPSLRLQVRAEFDQLGKEAFYARLIARDQASVKIKAGDSQRMMRAYEVLLQTGMPISYYQDAKGVSPLEEYDVSVTMLSPERGFLYKCCDERFVHLVENGGLEEVRRLISPEFSSELVVGDGVVLPKALGVAELCSYLNGVISLQEAISLAQTKTRQYAKRQITWFNNQVKDKIVV